MKLRDLDHGRYWEIANIRVMGISPNFPQCRLLRTFWCFSFRSMHHLFLIEYLAHISRISIYKDDISLPAWLNRRARELNCVGMQAFDGFVIMIGQHGLSAWSCTRILFFCHHLELNDQAIKPTVARLSYISHDSTTSRGPPRWQTELTWGDAKPSAKAAHLIVKKII